ncbi:fimbrial protein [Paenalcaligenes sp. Me131]|uniref:fimbrial protein n=1 Tax=Paenalcaligenes sp. Me131 TaxID=3392636 RepID=UPI003D26BB49
MKKHALNVALASALILPAAFANASTGNIDFEGEVTTETCSLEADSAQINVVLGSWAAHHINTLDRTTAKKFQIKLTGCDLTVAPSGVTGPVSKANFAFSGGIANSDPKLLKLNSAGGFEAKNLGIGISANPTDLTTARVQFDKQAPLTMELVDGDNTMDLYAFYEKFGTVEAGPANAQATFEVTYN